MWRHPVIKGVLLVYVGWGAWHWYGDRPVHPPTVSWPPASRSKPN
jgi:hypothetical protein